MLALVAQTVPRPGESASAVQHMATVRSRLLASFDVVRIVRIGSQARGTAVRRHSDLDVLAVLRRNEAKWGKGIVSSDTLLSRVREDLQQRFRNTDIRGDQQAAVISFAQGEQSLDVVPALWGRFSAKRPVYSIPDGAGGWLETSPEAHDRMFQVANVRSGGKLKALCRLMRWWKFSRAQPIPLQTFHTDVLFAAEDICAGAKPYTQCLYSAFRLLAGRQCRALRDPVGIAGEIPAAKTNAQRNTLVDAVEYSLQHATSALALESVGKLEQANAQWALVFNGRY
ncbi:MAG TPA: nucleotidyltransferase [Terriglobales bacterium]|nr:nucleotidyltransferase [Terriglobales bacterium]